MNVDLFIDSLGYMAQGMLGIMFVMALIAGSIWAFNKIFK